MDNKKLVEELTECAEWCDKNGVPRTGDSIMVAVNRIHVLTAQLAERDKQLANLRNELCQRCGKYHMAHKGACDGCRWRKSPGAEA